MDVKKIYLIRHGETDYNRTGVVQGSGVNSALNENGYRQAELFYEGYKDYPFEKVYTSSLRRTIQSVEKFIRQGIPHEILPGLNEISWGRSEGVWFSPETNRIYEEIIESWKQGNIHLKLDGGESPVEVKARQETAIHHILNNTDEKNVLVCMHGRAMKILLAWITGHSVADMDLFEHVNLSLYILHHNGEGFKIHTNNDVKHLVNYSPLV
ncbi:MAG: histidine phosphatase family protein [Cyclobacteriaceae bacterium]|nr:histidine phosphatase family protein [Cyclobacteriaceae bacterium]